MLITNKFSNLPGTQNIFVVEDTHKIRVCFSVSHLACQLPACELTTPQIYLMDGSEPEIGLDSFLGLLLRHMFLKLFMGH